LIREFIPKTTWVEAALLKVVGNFLNKKPQGKTCGYF
jgi:hypothetical protein